MDARLVEIDSWFVALVVGVLMLVGWALGLLRGSRLPAAQRSDIDSTFGGASMALLGLLLGFSFSMALSKHEQRRQMVIGDSNAIGDFATCASLLDGPVKNKLQKQVKDYVVFRLDLAQTNPSSKEEETAIVEVRRQHAEMTATVKEALGSGTMIAVPLTQTLNNLTSSHAARIAAIHDRMPTSIVGLLGVAAIITMVLVGIQQGASGHRQTIGTLGFVILVSLVVWVILDLNQPRRGLITVSQEPMELLLKEL